MDKEKLIADIKAMSVLELHELVKALEEEFGVSAAATAVAVAGPVAAAEEVFSMIRNFKGAKFNRLKNLFSKNSDFFSRLQGA